MVIVVIKQSECIGLPVISASDGGIVGRIKDFLISDEDKSIYGVTLEGSMFTDARIILLEDILKIGKDAMVVYSRDVARSPRKVSHYRIKDKEVYTRDGINLGIVKDIRINELSGEIECVEVSDGIISDIVNGRNVLPLIGKVLFSDNSIVVESQAYEEIELGSRGIIGYL